MRPFELRPPYWRGILKKVRPPRAAAERPRWPLRVKDTRNPKSISVILSRLSEIAGCAI